MDETIQQIGKPERHVAQTSQHDAKEADRITNIENDIKEIKTAIKGAITTKPRTWAPVAASANGPEGHNCQILESAGKDRTEKAKRERAKREVVISMRNASENMHREMEMLHEGAAAEGLQRNIRQYASMTTIKINGVKKMSKHPLKMQCETENDAAQLRALDWSHALEGAAVVKPMYGIVVHGVSKQDIDTEIQNQEEIVEHANNIKARRVAPLRRRTRNPKDPTQSIVIYTECSKEADE